MKIINITDFFKRSSLLQKLSGELHELLPEVNHIFEKFAEEKFYRIGYAINTDYSVHVYGSPLKLKFEYYPFIRVGRFKYSDDSVLFYRLVTRPGSQGYFLALITLEEFDSLCKTIDYSVLPQLNAIKYGKP